MAIELRRLTAADVPALAAASEDADWRSDVFHWWNALAKQEVGERIVLTGRMDGRIAGYVYLTWRSQYPRFVEAGVPEICDLRVARAFRRRGLATALIGDCEQASRDHGMTQIGLGVGLYAAYGAAQRLYARLGYRPDGHGVTWRNQDAAPGAEVRLDDELLLWLVKDLR